MTKIGLCFGLVAAVAASFCSEANAQCCDGAAVISYPSTPVITQSYVSYPVTWSTNVAYQAPMYRSAYYRAPLANRFRTAAYRPVVWQTPVVYESPLVYDTPVVWQAPATPCCG